MNKSSNEPSCTMTKSLTKTNKKIETPVKQNLRAICPKHKVFSQPWPGLTLRERLRATRKCAVQYVKGAYRTDGPSLSILNVW